MGEEADPKEIPRVWVGTERRKTSMESGREEQRERERED